MSKYFDNEQFKLEIDFSDVTGLSNYVITTLPNTGYIQTINTNITDGNRGDNPLGNMSSGRCYVSLFDNNDTVNPMNTSSVYAGYMTPGRKATLYKSADGETWTRYFGGTITNWQGSFKDGLHNITSITIEDDLNMIGLLDVSELSYSGGTAAEALEAIFTAFGLTSSDYDIDSSLSNIAYTQLKSPARRTINDILYRSLTYIQIKQNGKIYVKPLTPNAPSSADYELTADDVGNTEPINTSAVNFSKVKVAYTSGEGLNYQLIASKSDLKLNNGVNTVILDTLAKAFSIESVCVTVNEGLSQQSYTDITYEASDSLISIQINATLDEEKTGRVQVYGLIKGDSTDNYITVNLPQSSTGVLAETFIYESSNILTEAAATTLANQIAAFIISLRKQVKIKTSFVTPDLEVGDTVSLTNISSTYNGTYRVSAVELEYGETYNVGFTLLKLA